MSGRANELAVVPEVMPRQGPCPATCAAMASEPQVRHSQDIEEPDGWPSDLGLPKLRS
jgi:hypothetical protein